MASLEVAEHEANSKAVNALFAGISRAEFSRVQGSQEAHKIWTCLENYHEGTPQVKARLFETRRREYENRSTDALDYTEHEMALKLLYALDHSSVWDLKVNTIVESVGYETLTVNELFSKLKATEVDNQTRAKLF